MGDADPEGGYQVGDEVGLFYSDHDTYIFDNPTGVVVAIAEGEDGFEQRCAVEIGVEVGSSHLYLIHRKETP